MLQINDLTFDAWGRRFFDEASVSIPTGAKVGVSGTVTVAAAAPEGRAFFGRVQLVNARGTVAGIGNVAIEKVVP